MRKPRSFPELSSVVDTVLDVPAGWEDDATFPSRDQRVRLVYRLITEGSNALVWKVCLRLDSDRHRWGATAPEIPSWTEVARLARSEGLLTHAEGTLLAKHVPSLAVQHGT